MAKNTTCRSSIKTIYSALYSLSATEVSRHPRSIHCFQSLYSSHNGLPVKANGYYLHLIIYIY